MYSMARRWHEPRVAPNARDAAKRASSLLAVVSVVAALSGCAPPLKQLVIDEGFVATSPALRGARLVDHASTFEWEPGDFVEETVGPKTGPGLRAQLTAALQGVLGEPRADAKAARYRVRVVETSWPSSPAPRASQR